jgi:hypothetical protein
VTANPMTPPSGDKHDFSFVTTYAWPCNAMCPENLGAERCKLVREATSLPTAT